jgi:hypothetical protein
VCQDVSMTIRQSVLGFGRDLVVQRARRYSTPKLHLESAIIFPPVLPSEVVVVVTM